MMMALYSPQMAIGNRLCCEAHLPEQRAPPFPESVAKQQQQRRATRKKKGNDINKKKKKNRVVLKKRENVKPYLKKEERLSPADVVAFEALQSVARVGRSFTDGQRFQIGHQQVDGRFQFFNVQHLHLLQDEPGHQFPVLSKPTQKKEKRIIWGFILRKKKQSSKKREKMVVVDHGDRRQKMAWKEIITCHDTLSSVSDSESGITCVVVVVHVESRGGNDRGREANIGFRADAE